MKRIVLAGLLAVSPLALPGLTPAALAQRETADKLTSKQAGEVVDAVIKGMGAYFDPAVSAAVRAKLKERRPAYAKLGTRTALAEAMSADLFAVSHDQHLKVSVQTGSAQAGQLSDAEQALLDKRLAYGLLAVRRLPGNIGYLKTRYFEQTSAGTEMIDGAMKLLKDTDALIIDLRENTGGGGAADERLLGHLSATPIPMATIHWRNADGSEDVEQRQPSQPQGGPLYADKPVFVLTAKRTFSAAEEVAYDLQASGRAVLIGETTRGGGNPSRGGPDLGYGLSIFVPNGWTVHPTTGKGWEGIGVVPDVATPPAEALTEAFKRALAVAKPLVSTPRSEAERNAAIADPKAALSADQPL